MPRWDGFPEHERVVDGERRFRVCADYLGPDDDPIPVALLVQTHTDTVDFVQLRADDLVWLRDDVIPAVLPKMEVQR